MHPQHRSVRKPVSAALPLVFEPYEVLVYHCFLRSPRMDVTAVSAEARATFSDRLSCNCKINFHRHPPDSCVRTPSEIDLQSILALSSISSDRMRVGMPSFRRFGAPPSVRSCGSYLRRGKPQVRTSRKHSCRDRQRCANGGVLNGLPDRSFRKGNNTCTPRSSPPIPLSEQTVKLLSGLSLNTCVVALLYHQFNET